MLAESSCSICYTLKPSDPKYCELTGCHRSPNCPKKTTRYLQRTEEYMVTRGIKWIMKKKL